MADQTTVTEDRVTAEIAWLSSNGRPSAAALVLGLWTELNEARKANGRAGGGRPVKYHWEMLGVGETQQFEFGDRPSLVSSYTGWARRHCPSARFSSHKAGAMVSVTRVA